MAKGTVFLVEDDPQCASLLEGLFTSAGLDVKRFETGAALLANYEPVPPECLLIDIRLPGISGLEIQRRLRNKRVEAPVILMTGHGTPRVATQAFKQGAFDFLEKSADARVILDSVLQALRHDRATREYKRERALIEERFGRLTERERAILDLVVDGCSSTQIALRLSLSKKTVDTHRAHIKKKLETSSLVSLLKMAMMDEGMAERARRKLLGTGAPTATRAPTADAQPIPSRRASPPASRSARARRRAAHRHAPASP